ncbi:MAG TPA: hypothetical protein VK960_00550 [Acidimicrobiia bacterium]|nr:hypothetical protein [Acidimicrobiia bacterium]
MSGLRAIAALLTTVVVACGGADASGTTASDEHLRPAALEFAGDADRALEGTSLEDVSPTELAETIISLCLTDDTVGEAIAGLGGTGAAGESEIIEEVLLEGVRQVCPTGAAAVDSYLAAARDAIASSSVDIAFDDDTLVTAGTSVCTTLESGLGVEDAVMVAASTLYGVDAQRFEDLDTLIGGSQGIALGAALGAAATFLCPEYRNVVADFVAGS